MGKFFPQHLMGRDSDAGRFYTDLGFGTTRSLSGSYGCACPELKLFINAFSASTPGLSAPGRGTQHWGGTSDQCPTRSGKPFEHKIPQRGLHGLNHRRLTADKTSFHFYCTGLRPLSRRHWALPRQ